MSSTQNDPSPTPTFAVLPPTAKDKRADSNSKKVSSASTKIPFMTLPKLSMSNMNMNLNMDISGASSRAGNAIGSLLQESASSLSKFATKRYTLPDRSTASQVLMFRQLLHTSCKPGLRLSRKFQGTTAQRTVMHMPWWEKGVEQTGRMLISYDNLITRLWMSGAIIPYAPGGIACPPQLDISDENEYFNIEKPSPTKTETLCNEKGLPPIPHPWWVSRLGFQQEDPVTDFRSGGVLSLAMLLHIVESCPDVHRRFLDQGDVNVLPYAITSINVTDMLAKMLMFSKSVDKIDALLSSKPFWRMFSDPNALLTLQELSLDMLCDVVCELRREYAEEGQKKDVTVFDFHLIMERTEKRVLNDLLGAGPKTVDELRSIYHRMKDKYIAKMERQEELNQRKLQKAATAPLGGYSLNPLAMTGAFFSKKKPIPVNKEERKEDLQSNSELDSGAVSNFTISEDDEDDEQDEPEWLSGREDFEKPKDLQE